MGKILKSFIGWLCFLAVVVGAVFLVVPSTRNQIADYLAVNYSNQYSEKNKQIEDKEKEIIALTTLNSEISASLTEVTSDRDKIQNEKTQVQAQYEQGLITLEERDAQIELLDSELATLEGKINSLCEKLNIQDTNSYATVYTTNGSIEIIGLSTDSSGQLWTTDSTQESYNVITQFIDSNFNLNQEMTIRFSGITSVLTLGESTSLRNASVLIFEEGFTTFGNWVWSNENGKNIKAIYLPSTFTTWGNNAFRSGFTGNFESNFIVYVPIECYETMKEMLLNNVSGLNESQIQSYTIDALNSTYPFIVSDNVSFNKICLLEHYINNQSRTIVSLQNEITALQDEISALQKQVTAPTATLYFEDGTSQSIDVSSYTDENGCLWATDTSGFDNGLKSLFPTDKNYKLRFSGIKKLNGLNEISNITELIFDEGFEELGNWMFTNNEPASNITKIYLPSTFKTWGVMNFVNNSACYLEKIYIQASNFDTIKTTVINAYGSNITLDDSIFESYTLIVV